MRVTFLSAALLVSLAAFSADDITAFTGTWKEVVKPSPDLGKIVKYERTPDGKLKIIQTDLKEFVYDLDGKPRPDPTSPGKMGTTTVLDDSEFTATVTKDGQFEASWNRKVSSDGKHLTTTVKRKTPDGKMIEVIIGHERVSSEKQGFWGAWKLTSLPPREPSVMAIQVSKDDKISFSQETPQWPKAQCEGRIDGKDYPVRGYNVSMSFMRRGISVLAYTWKEVGQPVESGTWTLSSDHRTITEVQQTGKDNNITTTVYNRVN